MAEEIATLAAGCFWCVEAVFEDVVGVRSVEVGYTGGAVADPTYQQVCTGQTGHAEAARIVFDSAVISYAEILDILFAIHDPTQLDRQGNDIGPQYRSAIFAHSLSQRDVADAAIARAQPRHVLPVVTKVEAGAPWYAAEAYHQGYFAREGRLNPYCIAVIAPKVARFRNTHAHRLKHRHAKC